MIRNILLIICAFLCSSTAGAAKKKTTKKNVAAVTVTDLRTERMANPMSVDTPTPRLGWRIVSDKNDVMQTSYHIIVASTPEKAQNLEGDLWDTQVDTDRSQWIVYAGKELRSNTRCYWRVRVNTTKGSSDWSETAMWNIGLLNESDWSGVWIGLDHAMPWEKEEIHSQLGARYMRSEFELDKEVKCATLYISGLGMYEAFINGKKIGDDVLAPAPTDYRKTVLYNAFDVTDMLESKNAIAVAVGNGRYYTMQQKKKPYKIANFGYPKLRANLIIEFKDGKKKTISTNVKWKLNVDGAIRSNNEYDGEIYDARKELTGWSAAGYDDKQWMNAERVAIPYGTLRGAMSPNMKVVKTVKPVSLKKRGNSMILDMGQNMAGWLKVRINSTKAGDSIRLKFAEKLDSTGGLYTVNLRNALCTDYYVTNGKEQGRWWSPTFVYHGFRFVEVTGMNNALKDDFIGEVISDEMEETGTFASSDTILNKVYRNAVWGILSNYKGMAVDCPQRDERQPWLGDHTRGCFGEAYIFNNNAFYDKWARDITEAQREDGCIPDVAPAYWNYYSDNMTWPAALPFLMEMMYKQYGDAAPIRKYYANVKQWLEHMKYQYGKDGLMPRDKYGDWCMPPEELTLIHSKDPNRVTDGTLLGTAYYYKINKLMEGFARILSKNDDAEAFGKEAGITKDAFNKKFLTVNRNTSAVPGHMLYPDSTFYGNNAITANMLPVAFDMIDDDYVRGEVQKNIIKNIITDYKGHISCGVIGVQWLMHTLTDMERTDVAWLLATNKSYPSWGYMAENGATTIWELWNGDKANPWMNSGNHVMLLGDLISWLYEDVAGIQSDEAQPGFKHIIMRPDFSVDEMDDIDASYKSVYGTIVSRWKKTVGMLYWHVEIPANTTATLYMPDGSTKNIGSGVYDFSTKMPVKDNAVVADEFLYTKTSFPECHSATITETTKGDLIATYFGGTKERNPDVCIWISRKPKGSDKWLAPQLVADGVFKTGSEEARLAGLSGLDSTTTAADKGPILDPKIRKNPAGYQRKACWNPVVYQMPDGELQIYFKIGSNVADWTGWMIRSKDGGKTWSRREPLKEDYLGPVKNKPVMSKGRLIAPTSIEKGGWRLYFEYSDDMGKTWKRTDYVEADKGVLAIQPAIMTLKDGRLAAVARTRSEHIGITYSSDNGLTWSKLQLIDTPNNNSGLDAVTLKDGTHVLICNDRPIPKGIKNGKGLRTPVSVMKSDDGKNWKHWITLEDCPISQYSYPSIIQTSDGHIHCIYTWRRQRIKHVELVP
ncbi:family 78 glycoside hydrolase catalytic domain [Xylanibacter caecicola]|uniref:family 78 glycoside hydrolase catalytic domain n=1 Tax=Xylanibacter caecicola TaxID=2736294 RepID=UPI00258B5E22|nr:family 78 glycoside hydrolase catalytic domain [Xylanibacter caecicola]